MALSFSSMHKAVAYLLSGLGLIALSLGSELSQTSLGLIFVGYVVSWFAEEKLHNRPHYASGWTFAVVLLLALQVARGIVDQPTLAMAIEFAAFLQISRLFNRRTAIDYQQIAVLALLHLIAATVLSTTLSYGAVFAAFVIATPWMLALSHLRREIEGNYPAQSETDPSSRNAIRRVLASKRVVGPSFLLGTALLSLPLFAMTLAIFITIPRVGQGFLSFRRDTGQHVAGFGSQIELGGFGLIRDDPTVVLRVKPLPKVEQRAARLSLRLRGTSFDHYDGWRWTRTPSTSARLPHAIGALYPLRRLPREHDKELQIVLDHLEEPVVFLPEGTVALSVPPRVAGGESIVRELTHGPGLDVRYDSPDGLGLIYSAFVSPDPREAEIVPIIEERRNYYLQLPRGHERIAALAQQVVGNAPDDVRKAERIEHFLKRGEYTYSLKQPDVGKRLPLDVFLFEKKSGHCEYYSSAMAVMLRSVGVPTRNVTGFVGGQYNPYGGYYALRQGDAHSWVEAYLEGHGWVTFDPTPSARADFTPRNNLWTDLNALIDALRTRWTTSVIGYDLRVQVGMLQKLARMLAALSSHDARGGAEHGRAGDAARGALRLASSARVVGALVLVVAFAWLVVRFMRPAKKTGQRALSRQAERAVGLYQELERALARLGHARPPASTPLEHARGLRACGFARYEEVELVTRRYIETRYGGRPLRNAELAELRSAIARIRDAA